MKRGRAAPARPEAVDDADQDPIDVPAQALWGMGAAIHTPTGGNTGERDFPSGNSRAGSDAATGHRAPPQHCYCCHRRRAVHLFESPPGQWGSPHCRCCFRRDLHLAEEGYIHCTGCSGTLCLLCVTRYAEDTDDSSSASLRHGGTAGAAVLAPPVVLAAAAAAASHARQRLQDLRQLLTRSELSLAAAVHPVVEDEEDGRHTLGRQELRERLHLLTEAAEQRQSGAASASQVSQQLAAKRAADAAARREALEAVMSAAKGPTPEQKPPPRTFAIGDHVRYRDGGKEWRDGVVSGLEGGQPFITDSRRVGAAKARDEVEPHPPEPRKAPQRSLPALGRGRPSVVGGSAPRRASDSVSAGGGAELKRPGRAPTKPRR
eukprot:TRINITY_DN2599_c0_g1_i1.p1 TRINITY_DN2599_c0_g1~~TRINITY_DN2599_c0_g1_i1.p1  ORF type:complete len:376 (+),score=81.45 TRINITY_DN2599_c0_g1_i1:82-1209(+)